MASLQLQQRLIINNFQIQDRSIQLVQNNLQVSSIIFLNKNNSPFLIDCSIQSIFNVSAFWVFSVVYLFLNFILTLNCRPIAPSSPTNKSPAKNKRSRISATRQSPEMGTEQYALSRTSRNKQLDQSRNKCLATLV